MKKIIILSLFVAVMESCVIMYDKEDHYKLHPLYLLPGIGASSIRGSDSWVDPVGIQLGVETNICKINKSSQIRSGLGFSYQGAGYREPMVSGRVRLSYLNLPFIYSYEGKNKIYGEIGLQPGLLLSAKDKYNGTSYDFKDQVNSFELGLPVGVGYRINDRINLGIRGTYGLTKINKSGDVGDHNYMVVGLLRYAIDWPKKK